MRRAIRWSEELPVESKATAAALDALSPEVRDRVVQAANIGRTINIQKVSVSCTQFCCKWLRATTPHWIHLALHAAAPNQTPPSPFLSPVCPCAVRWCGRCKWESVPAGAGGAAPGRGLPAGPAAAAHPARHRRHKAQPGKLRKVSFRQLLRSKTLDGMSLCGGHCHTARAKGVESAPDSLVRMLRTGTCRTQTLRACWARSGASTRS